MFTEPAIPDDHKEEAPHPNDQLGVIPSPLRGMVASSLWDVVGAQAAAGGAGGGGDSISMKQQVAQRSQVRCLVQWPAD